MSAVQLWGGIAASTLIGTILMQAIPTVGSPITISELSAADGSITMDRTVLAGDQFFFAQSARYLVDAVTNESLPICEGVKNQRLLPGRVRETLSLAAWTGNPNCTLDAIPPGEWVPVAVYSWGDHRYTFAGPAFVIPEPRQSGT